MEPKTSPNHQSSTTSVLNCPINDSFEAYIPIWNSETLAAAEISSSYSLVRNRNVSMPTTKMSTFSRHFKPKTRSIEKCGSMTFILLQNLKNRWFEKKLG